MDDLISREKALEALEEAKYAIDAYIYQNLITAYLSVTNVKKENASCRGSSQDHRRERKSDPHS